MMMNTKQRRARKQYVQMAILQFLLAMYDIEHGMGANSKHLIFLFQDQYS